MVKLSSHANFEGVEMKSSSGHFPYSFLRYGYNYPASYNYRPVQSSKDYSAKSINQQRNRNRYSTYTDSVQNACMVHDTVVPSRDPYDLQTCYEDYYYEQYQDNVHTYRLHQNKAVLHQNCPTYNTNHLQDAVNFKPRSRKKYPVTVKTPK